MEGTRRGLEHGSKGSTTDWLASTRCSRAVGLTPRRCWKWNARSTALRLDTISSNTTRFSGIRRVRNGLTLTTNQSFGVLPVPENLRPHLARPSGYEWLISHSPSPSGATEERDRWACSPVRQARSSARTRTRLVVLEGCTLVTVRKVRMLVVCITGRRDALVAQASSSRRHV